jgi:hypothetical protein
VNEDTFNMALRQFLKRVGITSQREIEQAVRAAVSSGQLRGDASVAVSMTLLVPGLGVDIEITDTLNIE